MVSQDIFPLVVLGFTEYPFFIIDGTEKLTVLSLYSFFSEVNSDKQLVSNRIAVRNINIKPNLRFIIKKLMIVIALEISEPIVELQNNDLYFFISSLFI